MKSMSERLAFPMYAVNDEDTQALWRAVRQLLAARGVVEEDTLSYQVPEDLLTHWRHPALLLSQTCGYPLMTRLLRQCKRSAVFTIRRPDAKGGTTAACWRYVRRTVVRRWRIFAGAWSCAIRRIPSPAITCC